MRNSDVEENALNLILDEGCVRPAGKSTHTQRNSRCLEIRNSFFLCTDPQQRTDQRWLEREKPSVAQFGEGRVENEFASKIVLRNIR